MAISPKEAEEYLSEKDIGQTKYCEKRIDDMLRKGQRYFDRSDIGHKVCEELIRIYNRVGWRVRYESSPRNESFLVFEKCEGELMN